MKSDNVFTGAMKMFACNLADWIHSEKYRKSGFETNTWWKIGTPAERFTTEELIDKFWQNEHDRIENELLNKEHQ